MIGIDRLDFDGHFKIGLGVDGLVDFSEGTFVNLSDNFEILSHFLNHLRHSRYKNNVIFEKVIFNIFTQIS